MKVKVNYADHSESRFINIKTLEDLLQLVKEEKEDIIIEKDKPEHADIQVIVYNDYL